MNRAIVTLLLVCFGMAGFIAFSVIGTLTLSNPGIHDLPIAVANLDRGTTIAGRPVNFGRQMVGHVTGNPALRGEVAWSIDASRARVRSALDDDTAYGGLVIPPDFSVRLGGLLRSGMPTQVPATLEILTSPAAGSNAGTVASGILIAASTAINAALADQTMNSFIRHHVPMTPRSVRLAMNPVRVVQRVAEPTPSHTGRGNAPSFSHSLCSLPRSSARPC